ncbi:hypothetical protein RclHR1_19450001 [Rhizophagus clarus]|uniref:Protein kinase domain-containing protein n=1 Tax=Rhizophagus clarus TaxID=94130 RepID=A0A2Z6R2U5_9GLOM|nr:hypothetical protein RclHR1_19450001 [Rhizophagus clarus]
MSNQARYSNIHRPIPDEHIKYYDYSHFKDVRQIRNNMFRATWKITNRFFALKSLNNNNKQTFEQIIKELKLYRSIDSHENILQFYGITNVETGEFLLFDLHYVYQAKKYSLVLEYADSGTLNDYLNKYFNELDWDEKYQLSLQLTSAVEYIHNCGIIHCDLVIIIIYFHNGFILFIITILNQLFFFFFFFFFFFKFFIYIFIFIYIYIYIFQI